MKTKDANKIISAYEAREILGVPLSSLYYLSNTGKIKAIKIGRRWRYRRRDIEHYASFGTANPGRKRETARRERRAFPRLNCFIGCSFRLNLSYKQSNNLKGTIRNIAACGLFLDASRIQDVSRSIKNDDPVEMEFVLGQPYQEENAERIRLLGRVVRKEEGGLGIKYRGIPEALIERITGYVG